VVRNSDQSQSVVVGPFVASRTGTVLQSVQAESVCCVEEIGLVVRNREWHSVAPQSMHVLRTPDCQGGLVLHGTTQVEHGRLVWQLACTGRADGLDLELKMCAQGSVTVNRAGLVLLLPTDRFAGAKVFLTDAAGATFSSELPTKIAAHQPLPPFRALDVTAVDGTQIVLSFEGDEFEVEDHRNWLDPTFKFYNRPLSAPVPYCVEDGQLVRQRIRVTVRRLVKASRKRGRSAALDVGEPVGRLPALGVALEPEHLSADTRQWSLIKHLGLAFALIRILRGEGILLGPLVAQATACRLQIRLELIAIDEGDVQNMARCLGGGPLAAVHSVACHLLTPQVHGMLTQYFPGILVVQGTFGDFVHINRMPILHPIGAAMGFALCPTVHAVDNHSLIRSLGALTDVMSQARQLSRGAPLFVGRCALRRDLHPLTGTRCGLPQRADGSLDIVDSRQMLPIAAAWLACVIALCGRSGVNSLCTFEALGERGLIGAEPNGEQTALSPTALVLQELAKHQGASVAGVRLEAHQYGVFTLAGARHTLWVVELAGCALCLPLAHLSPISVHVLARRRGAFGWRAVSVGKELVQLQAYQIVRLDLPTPAWGDGVLSAVAGGLVRPPVCRPAGGTPASDFGDCMHNSANGG